MDIDIDGLRWCNCTYQKLERAMEREIFILRDVELLQLVNVVIHWCQIVLAIVLAPDHPVKKRLVHFRSRQDLLRRSEFGKMTTSMEVQVDWFGLDESVGMWWDMTGSFPSVGPRRFTRITGIQNHLSPRKMNIFLVTTWAHPTKS